MLTIDNAPPRIKTKSLKITRPEIYYGEVTHEPVFVNTAQKEFNYPSGEQNAYSKYEGKGGFPVSSFPMRIAAAVHEGEANILLTDYLTPEQPHDDPPQSPRPRCRSSPDSSSGTPIPTW